MEIGSIVRVQPGQGLMDGLGEITGYANDDYENAEELGYFIVDFGSIYGTCTVHRDAMDEVTENAYKCEFCGTVILWGGADEQRGELWSCEQLQCGKPFCAACFKDKHSFEAWDSHVNETSTETGIMCPECYLNYISQYQKQGGALT